MFKGVFLTESEIEEINSLLNLIDIEIGSTITFNNEKDTVMRNMLSADDHVKRIKEIIGE